MSEPHTCLHCQEPLNKKNQCRNGCQQVTAQPIGDSFSVDKKTDVTYGGFLLNGGYRRMPSSHE